MLTKPAGKTRATGQKVESPVTQRIRKARTDLARTPLDAERDTSVFRSKQIDNDTERFVVPAGANLYTALNLPNAEEREAKADLAIRIGDLIEAQGLTQAHAAKRTGLGQSDISNIVRGKTSGYTIDRLVEAINRLGHSVDIVVHSQQEDFPQTRVS